MQSSDVTQHNRRIRTLFDPTDVRAVLAAFAAGEAGVSLSESHVHLELVEFKESPQGGPQAEVIIVVDYQGLPTCGS